VDVALNWLWQGVLVAGATALLLRVIPATHPQSRYRLLWAALLSLYLLPVVAIGLAVAVTDLDAAMPAVAPAALVSLPAQWWTSDAAALTLWSVWVVATAAQSLRSLVALRKASRTSTPLSVASQTRLHHWIAVRATGRPAQLGISEAVPAAAVLTGAPPVIAIAPTLVSKLSDDELDRVVIHEWAHVQRRDDLAVVAQLVVRVTLGWHPATWWLMRQLHAEREAACDQLAVSITGSAKAYAGCLAKLATLRVDALRPLPVVGTTAGTGLSDRVVRILSPRRALSTWHRAGLAAASVVPWAVALAIGGVTMIEAATVVAEVAHIEPFASSVVPAVTSSAAISPTAETPGTSIDLGVARQPRFGTVSQDPVTSESPLQSPAAPPTKGGTVVPFEETPLPVVPSTFSVPLDSPLRSAVPARSPRPAAVVSATDPAQDPATIWGAAAESGTAVGRGSQRAAVATAGFFTRVSRKIAGSF
jgi:beta-lactamase regulating signal transducer with metallopeptidase domain